MTSALWSSLVTLAVTVSFTTAAVAQDSAARPRRDPSEPSAAHERMAVFEGTWTLAPDSAAERATTTPAKHEETCTWLVGGRRHMVCRSWTEAGNGVRREAIQVMSYRGRDSTYVSHLAFPGGATLTYHGRIEGARWIMNLEPNPSTPANLRIRTIITPEPDALHFVEEASEDGGAWQVTEDYRHLRVRR